MLARSAAVCCDVAHSQNRVEGVSLISDLEQLRCQKYLCKRSRWFDAAERYHCVELRFFKQLSQQ